MSIYTIESGYQKPKKLRFLTVLIITAGCIFTGYLLFRPQTIKPVASNTKPIPVITAQPKITAPIPWPGYGQAAYGVDGVGVLAASNDNAKPVPVASLAKVITALAILKQKPLAPGEQGPILTLTEQDIALYGEYIRKDGSVLPVEVGEQISQHQAMQAMLMTSANNITDTLVIWAFGSVENYTIYANNMVKELGLTNTHVQDASGFSAGTVSTAHDLVKLGTLYIENPVLRDIAQKPDATIPFAGKIQNYNSVINENGILGIKVGYTDEAGRSYLAANLRKTKEGKDIIAIVAVVGADHLTTAMKDAQTILAAGNTGFDQINY